MSEREEKKKKLKEAASVSKQKADELLDPELQALKNVTQVNLEALRPKITDKQSYEKLIEIVQESTTRNETLAELKSRLEKAGTALLHVAKETADLLKTV